MTQSPRLRDTARRELRVLALVAIAVLIASACSGDEAADPIVPWSQDPCGLAPPQDIAAAFGIDPIAEANAPPRECRYMVGDTLVRITVLADTDVCTGVGRNAAARGETLTPSERGTDGVFVLEPHGDVVVCGTTATFVLMADGRTAPLLNLAGLGLGRRAR